MYPPFVSQREVALIDSAVTAATAGQNFDRFFVLIFEALTVDRTGFRALTVDFAYTEQCIATPPLP